VPCDIPIGAAVTVSLNVAVGAWLDTGVDVNPGECLQVSAPGTTVKFGTNADQCAYPEGYYSAAASPCAVVSYDPSAVDTTYGGEPGNLYITREYPAYCLLAKIQNTQPTGTHLTGTLRPNRSTVFPSASLSGGGRVWLAMNDNIFTDNSGTWAVTLQRYISSVPPPPYAVISPLGGTIGGTRFSPMTHQVYQGLSVTFPLGYAVGTDISSAPGLFSTLFTSVRVRGPYRAYLVGSILHVVNDSGELASGTALDGVDILRIGT
jgi:hypothetical protein